MVQHLRLQCAEFWVDARLLEVNGRWLASADTQHGPTLGCGATSMEALWLALEPFSDVVGELLASVEAE